MSNQAPRGLGRVFDLRPKDPNIQRRDDSRDAEIRQLSAKIGDGAKARLIKDISVSTTKVNIPHLLGKAPLGWRVADISATGVTIKRVSSVDENKWLSLIASGSAVISLEIW